MSDMDTRIPEGRVEYEEWLKTKKYVTVTTVSFYHHRYVVTLDEFEKINNGNIFDLSEQCMNGDIQEFSQNFVSESVLAHEVINEDKMLDYFDNENQYLTTWSKDQKINYVRNLRRDT